MFRKACIALLLVLSLLNISVTYAEEPAADAPEGLAEGAFFDAVLCEAIDSVIYEYTASNIYNPGTSMVTCFQIYADSNVESMEDAWKKLQDLGMIDLAEENHAVVYLLSPANKETYTEEDYKVWCALTKAYNNGKDDTYTFDPIRQSFLQKKVYVIGEGQGADFIASYLHTDVSSGLIAGELLAGALQATETGTYAIPAYLAGCEEQVLALYQSINGTDAEESVEDLTVYYNSQYVMDSGYTPKRVIVDAEPAEQLTADLVAEGWDQLLRHVWNDQLQYNYFTEGVECGVVSELPDLENLHLIFQEISGEEAKETTVGRWYEWVPEEVFETMNNGTDETYPLIMINHGAGDHEIYEAQSNGWVDLAGRERVIVVAARDIFQSGRPPESAATRYGAYNGEFIRNVICEKYPVDMSRIYIAGFSIGGFVTADTSSANPDLFAAAACMAYPGDGFMQIFPWEANGSDAEKYDIPVMYMCGNNDGNNLMSKPGSTPGDMKAEKVMSTQLMFNQIMEFNEMTDQMLDLEDFEYDWYPGEKDQEGYEDWDGTAAEYITQNLDFDAWPFYGFDLSAIPNTSFDTFETVEGVQVERSIYYNEENWPMLEQLRMGDMGHYHYTRYAQIIWDDMFSHFVRNPETGELSYNAAGEEETVKEDIASEEGESEEGESAESESAKGEAASEKGESAEGESAAEESVSAEAIISALAAADENGISILDMAAQIENGTYAYQECSDGYSWMLENVLYCANPVDTGTENIRKQCMNIYVPKGFMNEDGTLNYDAEINGYTIETVPIIYMNGVGGYAEALPKTPDARQWTEALAFIQCNYVLVSPGSRGIETQKEDGTWIGKAPAGLVDLKAGVRFLKYNDAVLPGDSAKIISIGTSAGGAMSMLLGVSGNNEVFDPYLEEIGAVMEEGVGDDVYAAQAFCPITDLDNANMAYEWNFGANDSWSGAHSEPASGTMNEFQKALSQVLAENYIDYVNSLNLGLTLDSARSGSYYDGLMEVLSDSLNSYLDERYDGSDSEKAMDYVTSVDEAKNKVDFTTFAAYNEETGRFEITDLDAYVTNYRGRIKMCPSFDHLLYNEAENQLFGNASVNARHFSTAVYQALQEQDYSVYADDAAEDGLGYQDGLTQAYAECQDEEVLRLSSIMNAMNYITVEDPEEQSDFAPYIRIRVGSNDSDTAFTVTYNLALALEAFTDTDVDYAIKWGQSHGNCNDAANVVTWIDEICK